MRRLVLHRHRPARDTFHALGATVRVVVSPQSQTRASVALVRDWFEQVEAAASRFRPESELNRLVRAEIDRPSPLLAALLAGANDACRITDGLVTPYVRPMVERAGYRQSFDSSAPAQPQSTRTSQLPETPWRDVDFGGTGKGWAVDRALQRLRPLVAGALIDAGGDIGVFGDPPQDRSWYVSMALNGARVAPIAHLRSGGIATSSVLRRAWTHNGRAAHHLIDPATGQPSASDVLEATVWARSTFVAEVAAKALVLRGTALAPTVRRWFPEAVCAWTTTDGNINVDSAFHEEVLACVV